jgi:mannose-6-phosphate isomerase-like protein (cupin superfamily)
MKILAGGCRVYAPEDGQVSKNGNWTSRAVICRATGAKQVTQSVNDYQEGRSPAVVNPTAEEVLYVASGVGVCWIDGSAYDLRAGVAVYVPPGSVCSVKNARAEALRIVSACCPEDLERRVGTGADTAGTSARATLAIHEDEREQIQAGQDRVFRYLVHTDLGCKQVTQFVGWIPTSKAPFHLHTYEEAIYILEGQGILHLKGHLNASEFGPGSSIYLPDGVVHCLENPGPAPVRVLGIFHPSGSPGAAYETED